MTRIILPDVQTLTDVMAGILRKDSPQGRDIVSLERLPSSHGGTLQAEIVTCRFHNGNSARFFCKYTGDEEYKGFSHKKGVAYESEVYLKILRDAPLQSPYCHGSAHIPQYQCTVLVLDYLEAYDPLQVEDLDGFAKAASAIGHLHREMEGRCPSFLNRYDRAYYLHWYYRNKTLLQALNETLPWISGLCEFYTKSLDVLLDAPQTIVHGEYYSKNILINGDLVCPVDWESAAAATGELDLASLLDGSDSAITATATKAYLDSRWPEGVPDVKLFQLRVLLGSIYFYFRWMADDPVGIVSRWANSHWIRVGLRDIALKAEFYQDS